jgi:3-hydroxyanthranilate 3,4-dioxygenase
MPLAPINLKRWIDEHRDLLKPPVGNKMVWQDREFLVMVVGGPNQRKDYHVEEGEEFFFQIEGDIVLKVIEDGVPRDIPIREGEMFLLPAGIPHSPQRPAGTVGLVIERKRVEGELDHLRWFCEKCGAELHDAEFQLVDLGKQLKPIIEGYYADTSLRTCRKCGHVMEVPAPAGSASPAKAG